MHGLPQLALIFGTAFVVGFSGAMMPGPLLAVTIHESARRGSLAGPLIVLGHAVLEAALVSAIVLGLAAYLRSPVVIGAVGILGGAMMGWMGQDMVRSAGRLSLRAAMAEPGRMHPIAAGILVSLSNPYWTIWWATTGITYLAMGLAYGMAGILAFFAGHILSDLTWYTLVSDGVARGRTLVSDTAYRRAIAVCGVALVAFGVWFLSTGVGRLAPIVRR
jgi:threonine/homoserine/homoserine lactone efflux protein